jgi:glutamate-1-semialdehyde 2,1-aminomutase
MMTLFFHPNPVNNWTDADQCDRQQFAKYFWGMIEQGIYMPCSQFEALFVGAKHTDEMIDQTVEAAAKVLRSM